MLFDYSKITTISLLILFTSCQPETAGPCTFEQALHGQAPYPLGFAADVAAFRFDPDYQNHSSFHFNSITAENALKMEHIQPARGGFEFVQADSLVNLALRKGMRVHGHTLIWHNQNPPWLSTFSGDRQAWIDLMKEHINTVIQHFSGRIHSWDVVNEAFEDNGDLRETVWRNGIGDDYIELAFQFAAEADPDAMLFYNDYNLWRKSAKCRAVLALAEHLQKKGIPIQGIGFQGHIDIRGPGQREIELALEELSALGLQVHISELDVSVNPLGKASPDLEGNFGKQAEVYRMVAEAYTSSVPADQQFGITFWGLADAHSWIPSFFNRADAPLLWDANYMPKPALCGFMDGI
ncbi:MAG: endo-1,4-beta-xylanase [Bacteroidia bacterium]